MDEQLIGQIMIGVFCVAYASSLLYLIINTDKYVDEDSEL